MKLINHKKYMLEICEEVDHDLTSLTCRKLREHLENCPDCAAYYDSLKKTIVLYRNYDVEYKGTCVKEVLARLELERPIKISLPKKHQSKGPRRSSGR